MTEYVAPKIKADSNRCGAMYKDPLYTLWTQHPNVRNFCCFKNSKYYFGLIQQLGKFKYDFYKSVGGLTSKVAKELRKELKRLCSSSLSDPFCFIYPALSAIDLSARLPPTKSKWMSITEQHKNAVRLSFAILSKKYPNLYPDLVSQEEEYKLVVDCTNIILKHVQKNEVSQLRVFASYLPSNDAYKTGDIACKNDRLCIFLKIVEQVRMYLNEVNLDTNPVLINGKKRLILNTAVDYREFLKQKQLDRILTVLAEQRVSSTAIANDLKTHSTTKFTELRTYFEKVERFNQQIATADIAFVNGRLKSYTSSIGEVVGTLKKEMTFLLHKALIGVGLNIAEKGVILAMEIAEAANPLKWLTGGGAASDILKATAELQNAIAGLAKLKRIESSFEKLKNKVMDVAIRIEKNDKFLQDVKNLIERDTVTRDAFEKSKNRFLQKYNAYDPQVSLADLSEIHSLWNALIEAACEVVEAIDTAAGAPIKILINEKGTCTSLTVQTSRMATLYESIHAFQFDLVNAMFAYVRSSVSLDAAKEIKTEFAVATKLKNFNSGSSINILALMGGLSYVAFKVHILQTVYLYCNVLEYMRGGKQPVACKGAKTDLALLLATSELVCRSETDHFYRIPTKLSPSDSKEAYIDLARLFSGDDVTFKVPSVDWLIENKWIRASEKDLSFYVKRFEVYLPTKPKHPHMFYTTVNSASRNEIIPGSTEYTIIPNSPLVYEYTMGPSYLDCHGQKFRNPYTSCEENSAISEVCMMSHSISQNLYPSIYSQWTISVKGEKDRNMTVPNPATDLHIIIAMQLCKIAPNEYNYNSHLVAADLEESSNGHELCCAESHYRPTLSSSCMPCPPKSHSALAGYYCEND